MGKIQSAINNILGAAAVGVGAVKKEVVAGQKAAAAEQAEKLEAAQKEQADIEATSQKLAQARKMAVGYSQADVRKQEAAEAMGVTLPEKKPRGVQTPAFTRRMANAKAMEEIHTRYAQDKDFRRRIANLKAKDIAKAIKPEIDKKGGKK